MDDRVTRYSQIAIACCLLPLAAMAADIRPIGGGHIQSLLQSQTKLVARQAVGVEAGTSTQVLHGNAGGDPTWSSLSLSSDITGTLGAANGGIGTNSSAWTGFPQISAGVWAQYDLFASANIWGGLNTWNALSTMAGIIPVNSTDDLGAINYPFDTVFADSLDSTGAAAGGGVISTKVSGAEAYHFFLLYNNGEMAWGPGTGTQDTTLSRTGVSTLSLGSGDSLTVPGTMTIGTLAGYLKGTAGVVSAVTAIPVSDISGNPVTGTGTQNKLAKFLSSSSVGDSSITETNGNVGIGTTGPGAELHVNNSSGQVDLWVQGTSSAMVNLISAGAGNSYINFGTAGEDSNLYFRGDNGASDLVTILDSGNVGINDTTPDALLDIAGTLMVDSTTQLGGTLTVNAETDHNGTVTMGSGYQIAATTGTVGSPGVAFNGDLNTGMWAPSADVIAFSTSGAERMRISQGVGIGTNEPIGMLDIRSEDDSTVVTVGIRAVQSEITALDTFVDFRSNTGSEGSIAGTASAGVISYNTFTASHYSQIVDIDTIPAAARIGALIEIVPGNPSWPKRLRTPATTNVVEAYESYKTNRILVTNMISSVVTNFTPVTNSFPVVDGAGNPVLETIHTYQSDEQISTNSVVVYIRDGDQFRQQTNTVYATNIVKTVSGTSFEQMIHSEIVQQPDVVTNWMQNTEWETSVSTNYFPTTTNVVAATYFESSGKSHLWKSRLARAIPANKLAIGVYLGTDKEGRDMVASIGTCVMWVSDDGGDIEAGDFLMSSSSLGCAQRQADDFQHNYTVGKATENLIWADEGGKKRKRIKCLLVGD